MPRTLLDWEWEAVSKALKPRPPRPFRKAKRKGGRPLLSDRACFEGMLWILTKGEWRTLPKRCGTAKTVLARLKRWGNTRALWRAYLERLPRMRRWALEDELRDERACPRWGKPLLLIYELEYDRRGEAVRFHIRQQLEKRMRALERAQRLAFRRRYGGRLEKPSVEA